MASRDIDTELDQALEEFRKGIFRPSAMADSARSKAPDDLKDFLSVVERLSILAPTPEPELDWSRQRVLAEAAAVGQVTIGPRIKISSPRSWVPRPALALFAVIVVLFLSGVFAISSPTFVEATPAIQTPATPVASPTLVATPTRTLSPASASVTNRAARSAPDLHSAYGASPANISHSGAEPTTTSQVSATLTRLSAVLAVIQCWIH